VKLSVCIPTYNRAVHLRNCLQSIASNRGASAADFEVCVSDNCSTDDTAEVVRRAQQDVPIRYHRNASNLGIPRNFLNVVRMAEGEFVWLVGDDDLLLPHALQELAALVAAHPGVDFFYVNSYHLSTEHVLSFPQPFDVANLPERMTPFSSWSRGGEMPFLDLIDPRVSFDFLGGMFLAVFRRRRWLEHAHVLKESAIRDPRPFSHFDNTFPHVKIFANAFAGSKAFFVARPLSVCLTGAREWAPMYPMIKSVRLMEALVEYRRNGLPLARYLRCRNFALDTFIPNLAFMILHRRNSGLAYVNPVRLILGNLLYPNLYLSPVYYALRKARAILEGRGRKAAP
jgi:glycosyltransferase involved in cell wall biosynthesis